MFTGIVEETGEVVSLARSSAGIRLTVSAREVASGTRLGESIAVNGCCLTVSAISGMQISFDLLEETLMRTNLHVLHPGTLVNLERALPANARLGGHFVQGHIDAPSAIIAFERVGADHRLEIALPQEFARYAAFKGSIAVNGMSLTIAELAESSFTIWIIPHTYQVTNLQQAKSGDLMNLEFDLLAKYTERLLAAR